MLNALLVGRTRRASTDTDVLLTPQSSRIRLELERPLAQDDSEAILECGSERQIDCIVRGDTGSIRVRAFNFGERARGYVQCAGSGTNVAKLANDFRLGLGLFLRRRAFICMTRDGRTVTFNLTIPDRALSYGPLVRLAAENDGEVLWKLIQYSRQRQVHFFIEALSNAAPLEVRLLNAFVHLEIVDGSRTLSPNHLAGVLKIRRADAEAIVHVRNMMVHEGMSLPKALNEAHARMRSKQGDVSSTLEQALGMQSAHGNFYGALMDLLTTHLADEAGIPAQLVTPRVALSFQRDAGQN
jgi:hypothetical protein